MPYFLLYFTRVAVISSNHCSLISMAFKSPQCISFIINRVSKHKMKDIQRFYKIKLQIDLNIIWRRKI